MKTLSAALVLIVSTLSRAALAQPDPPPPPPPLADPTPLPPEPSVPPEPSEPPPSEPPPSEPAPPAFDRKPAPEDEPNPGWIAPPREPEPEERMSEGRAIASAWNSGFQWGIAPGVVFVDGKTGFAMGLRFGYGFDTGSVILVPGVRLAGYFLDPNVYLGMPVMKLVYPIDRFAPFIEGGAGVGNISSSGPAASQTGAALLVGGGFMIHFSLKFGLGVEANYQVVTGTGFKGFGVGPILALAF